MRDVALFGWLLLYFFLLFRPRSCSVNGFTPLHTAVANHHIMVVNLLCEAGANVHARTNNAVSVMHVATLQVCGW